MKSNEMINSYKTSGTEEEFSGKHIKHGSSMQYIFEASIILCNPDQ